ncbi:MAG: hypothetical protein U0271_14865 [Polyangiaceae bacterium]
MGHTLAVTYGLLPFGELFLTGRADRVDLAAGTLFVVLVVSNWCQTRALDSHDEEETRAAQRAAAP